MHPINDGGPPAGSPGEKASQMLSLAAQSVRNVTQTAPPFKHLASVPARRPNREGGAMADVTFITEKTRESFRARRSRALEAALRCAREASKPGTDQARAIALLCAVGRYAEQLRPGPGLEGAR